MSSCYHESAANGRARLLPSHNAEVTGSQRGCKDSVLPKHFKSGFFCTMDICVHGSAPSRFIV